MCSCKLCQGGCDDIDQYVNVPSPTMGDMEINLDDVSAIECVEVSDSRATEEILVDGGTLTLRSCSNVRCANRTVVAVALKA